MLSRESAMPQEQFKGAIRGNVTELSLLIVEVILEWPVSVNCWKLTLKWFFPSLLSNPPSSKLEKKNSLGVLGIWILFNKQFLTVSSIMTSWKPNQLALSEMSYYSNILTIQRSHVHNISSKTGRTQNSSESHHITYK